MEAMDILYYFENDLYVDFRTIRGHCSMAESTLYRYIKRKVVGKKFRNRMLYKYKDLIELPEIYKEIKNYEILK